MINRFYKDGEKLDVAGLNEITVLIDRSETEITEVGWNTWKPNLDGPPHRHNDKDQVFYITDGVGIVKLGEEEFAVEPGDLCYVPAGLVHQSITTGSEPMSYMLFNVFSNPSKEGHATFKEHIEKVKATRRQQADSGSSGADNEAELADIKKSRFIKNIYSGKKYEFSSNSSILLLDRNETNRLELTVVVWPAGNKGALVAHSEKEQTFFVLKGKGIVTVGGVSEEVRPGSTVFVPRNTPHATEVVGAELSYLCLNGLVEVKHDSFDSMYKSVASQRIERWKNGSTEVGE